MANSHRIALPLPPSDDLTLQPAQVHNPNGNHIGTIVVQGQHVEGAFFDKAFAHVFRANEPIPTTQDAIEDFIDDNDCARGIIGGSGTSYSFVEPDEDDDDHTDADYGEVKNAKSGHDSGFSDDNFLVVWVQFVGSGDYVHATRHYNDVDPEVTPQNPDDGERRFRGIN